MTVSGDISSGNVDWRTLLACVLRPSRDSIARHFSTHRVNCLVMTFVTALAGVSLWTWDFIHDPAGAETTVWLRLTILPTALPYMASLWFKTGQRFAFLAALTMFIGWELGFFFIMSRIEEGFVYGLSGFMFFVFMPLLATRCFTFAMNAILVAVIVVFPLFIAAIGDFPLFEADKYTALLVPAGGMSLVATFIMAWLYSANDLSRQTLEQEATTDALTGLSNRRRFHLKLKEAARHQGEIGLLMLDIDHFKRINDTLGHVGGDELLIQVALRLRSCVRTLDELARLGGDEFAVILGGEVNETQARAIAERILEALDMPFAICGESITVSASIGMTILPSGEDTEKQIYHLADAAMYAVKTSGRRGYRFEAISTAINLQ